MKPSLQLRLGHQLTMTPQLQQAIRLLQLSAVDIQREIQTALENNTMLELIETSESLNENMVPENVGESLPFYQVEENSYTVWENKNSASTSFNTRSNPIEALNANQTSLRDHLFWQVQMAHWCDTDRLIAAIIIDSINDDGYLTCLLDDIVITLQQTIEK